MYFRYSWPFFVNHFFRNICVATFRKIKKCEIFEIAFARNCVWIAEILKDFRKSFDLHVDFPSKFLRENNFFLTFFGTAFNSNFAYFDRLCIKHLTNFVSIIVFLKSPPAKPCINYIFFHFKPVPPGIFFYIKQHNTYL